MPRLPGRTKGLAKGLRRNSTHSEKLLWGQLRNRRLVGFKFRRQVPIGDYIVDFYCEESKVILELDGESHLGKEQEDKQRQDWLEAQGFFVVRVTDTEAFKNLDGVKEYLLGICRGRMSKNRLVD